MRRLKPDQGPREEEKTQHFLTLQSELRFEMGNCRNVFTHSIRSKGKTFELNLQS